MYRNSGSHLIANRVLRILTRYMICLCFRDCGIIKASSTKRIDYGVGNTLTYNFGTTIGDLTNPLIVNASKTILNASFLLSSAIIFSPSPILPSETSDSNWGNSNFCEKLLAETRLDCRYRQFCIYCMHSLHFLHSHSALHK